MAIVNGDDDAVQYLVAVAFSRRSSHLLDIRDTRHGHTALHDAVVADRPSVVRLLVVAGASLNARSRLGQTPMLLACALRRTRCLVPLTRAADYSDRDRLMKYCTDVGLLPASLPPPSPTHQLEINLLDFAGTQRINQAYSEYKHSLTFRVQRCVVETRAAITNPSNSIQLEGTPYHSPSYIRVRAVVFACGQGQTDRHTDRQTHTQTRVTTIHFASSTTHAQCNNIEDVTCKLSQKVWI